VTDEPESAERVPCEGEVDVANVMLPPSFELPLRASVVDTPCSVVVATSEAVGTVGSASANVEIPVLMPRMTMRLIRKRGDAVRIRTTITY
jgi:hypothetical protein